MAEIIFSKSNKNSSGSYVVGRIVYSYTQNTGANTSSITATLYVRKDNDDTKLTQETVGDWRYKLSVNGNSTESVTKRTVLTSWKDLATKTISNIQHNSDGTLSIPVVAYVQGPSGSSYSGCKSSYSGTITLPTIPRASSITSVGAITLSADGTACNVVFTPLATTFYYTLNFTCGGVSYSTSRFKPGVTSAYTYNQYKMKISDWAKAMPKAYSGTCTVTLYTYTDSTSAAIGSSSKTFTLTLPNTVKPTISFSDPVLVDGWNSCYVQGKSKCTLSATFATGTGSSISSCSISGTGLSLSGSGTSLSGTTSVFTTSGSITYTAKVTDGRTTVSATKTITVYAYAKPTLSISAARTSESEKAKIAYNATCSSVNSKNQLSTLTIYKRKMGESTWTSVGTITLSGTSINNLATYSGFESLSSYDIKAEIKDTYGSAVSTTLANAIPSEFRLINIKSNKKGIAFGKMAEEDNVLSCNLVSKFSQDIYASNGTILTSDRAKKTNIVNMSDTQEQLFNKLQPVTFKFIDGSSGRTHYGFISQDVEDALRALDLTSNDFAGFCKDVRTDKHGNQVDEYALRYSEFIALNTFMIQKLQAENAELKSELQALKEMIVGTSSKNVE